MGALAALSATLLGCASGPPVKDATVFSDGLQKGKDDLPVTSRPAAAPTNVDEAVKQAQAQRKSGDFSTAAHTLSQLVLLAPDDARVLGEYGKTLIAMGRTDDALAFLERAVELQPRDWSLFSAQGVAYDQKGEYLAAQAAYDRALLLKPGEPTVLSNAALSHVQTGDLDGAEALLLQASPSSGEFPRIASNLALVRSLKNSRPPPAPSVVPAKELTLVPGPVPAETPDAPDTPMVATLPVPEPASVAETPAGEVGESAATASAFEQLQMDPSVRMQSLPSEPPAAAATLKPTGAPSTLPGAAPKTEPVLQIRPTPDDDKPSASRPKKDGAKKTASAGGLGNRVQASNPLGLRPAVVDPPAARH